MTWKKIWKYLSNLLLIAIILILFIPSWRVSFQGWFNGLFMGEIEMTVSESIELNNKLDRWELFDMQSKMYNFTEFEGKPLIISFWATWCAYCRPELSEINELKSVYGDKLGYLSISEETLDVLKGSGLHEDYDFLYFTQEIPTVFEVNSYPSLFIINKDNEIVFRQKGAGKLNTEENRKFLDKLIAEQK